MTMNKTELISKAGSLINKIGYSLQKHGPQLLLGGGVIGMVASAVMACKATTKVSTIMDKAKEDMNNVHEFLADESHKDEYTEKDGKKDLAIIYAKTGLKLAKLYLPSVSLGMGSIACILTSHNMMSKRTAALAAAYATVSSSFGEYRERVTSRFGEAVDRELRHNITSKEVKETVIDENGKEKKIKKTVEEIGEPGHSDFAKVFGEGTSELWEASPKYMNIFLHAQQNYANDKLRAQGYLTLNEVYEMLGFKPTKAGQFVGWVYSKHDPKGDNWVDFGIRGLTKDEDFAHPVALDFNVDGYIWDDAVEKGIVEEV